MPDAVQIIITMWTSILATIPSSPFMYFFALAIVLIIVSNIFSLFSNR